MTETDGNRLTFRQARSVARGVLRADLGREAVATVRPPGVSGLARARGPLCLRLYLASRTGLLVWRNDESFAVLQPRAAGHPKQNGGRRHRLLEIVDRRWDLLVFGVPPLFVLLGAMAVASLRGPVFASILLVLAAVVYVLIFMTVQVALGIRWFSRLGRRVDGPDRSAAESLPAYQWSLPLLHQIDPAHADELLRLVTDRVARMIESRLERVAQEEGVRVGAHVVHQTVVLLNRGVTTRATRQILARESPGRFAPFGSSGEVLLILSGGRLDEVPRRQPVGGDFALLYLAGVATAIAVCGAFVAADEAAICGADCAGRPATWWAAVRYLGWRLLFVNPPELSPTGLVGNVFGWLTSLLGLTAVFVLYVAGRAQINLSKADNNAYDSAVETVTKRVRVLLLVVTAAERDAVLASAKAHTNQVAQPRFYQSGTVHELGTINNADLFLAQASEPGILAEAAMGQTARAAIGTVRPDYVILVGICYGLWPALGADGAAGRGLANGWQQMGDVLVSRRVQGLDHMAIRERDGVTRIIRRGVHAGPSALLLDRCNAAQMSWRDRTAKVHFGLMLSSNTLFDSEGIVVRLREELPDAIGGEMEAIGVYEAATALKVDWIMVKSICDWGFAKSPEYHARAARNAAEFVTHLVTVGALDVRRRGRPGGPA